MALNFYADANLTLTVGPRTPKRFLMPSKGGTKTTQLWLGDPYFATVTHLVNPGDTSITLADTSEFLSGGGTAQDVLNNIFIYTGKTQNQLIGVSGVSASISIGGQVFPIASYGNELSNIQIFPYGPDLQKGVQVALGVSSVVGFPGMPAIFGTNSILTGVANALEVFLSVNVVAGEDEEFTNWGIQPINLYYRDFSDGSSVVSTEYAYSPKGSGYIYRHDESLPLNIRLLSGNRKIATDTPGFIVGQYRWRDQTNRNATALIPTRWDTDPASVGLQNFAAGIGDLDDLEPQSLNEIGDSIYITINDGTYFTGANGYYLPADPVLEFLPVSDAAANTDGTVTLNLQKRPRSQGPVYVGTYGLDGQGFYEKDIEFKYMATLTNPNGSPRTDLPARYFTTDRVNKRVTLSGSLPNRLLYLGSVSGQAIDYFDLAVYPVDQIINVFINRGPNLTPLYATTWTYNAGEGTLQVPSIPGALKDQPMYALCSPAVAVLYDAGPDNTRQIQTVDFNPAFSGIAGGYFYLQHTRQKPASITLACDKPLIPIPATVASIIGLIAYGPVYFENDYALLIATAYGAVPGEIIPNAKLDIVVDPTTFSGTINYQDPLSTTVSVITGGDGTANLIFIPSGGFGTWIPTIPAAGGLAGIATRSIVNDTLVLPAPVPVSQVWDATDGWLVETYNILNTDPLFGMLGADYTLGEIAWVTTGTPGHANYKTNGERRLWSVSAAGSRTAILPIDALDSNGVSYTSGGFLGTVKSLVYAQAVSPAPNIGAYFVAYLQRVMIKMRLDGSDLFSNSILLQMAVPQLILDDPWLTFNDTIQGIINQYRLGWNKSLGTSGV